MNAIPPTPRPGATATEAALKAAPIGDIRGALGSIPRNGGTRNGAARGGLRHRLRILLAIVGPGLIVMVGDNDAGAFATYTQAGQNHGTALLWTLLLLIPVLYANQEMVLRLGAVTGVGYTSLLLARFGRFWGMFTILGLLALNIVTVVTEFIGISLALDQLGITRLWGVVFAAGVTILAAATGDFRRFERFALALVLGSLLLIPVFIAVHPPLARIAHDLVVPQLPEGNFADILLLIIAIIGTTVAPWQLFFQQSYIVDKRITPRYLGYEKFDLWLGIAIVILGAIAMMGLAAATFAGRPEFGQFTDAGGVAAGIAAYVGPLPAALFSIALLDASIIGMAAVSLSTAYAVGDIMATTHSLHRKTGEAKTLNLVYAGVIVVSAALVLLPDMPLGLITVAVQTLSGVMLPGATIFLLLLCNDRAVLGPWVNGPWANLFTSSVIAILVLLSLILTAAVLFPGLAPRTMLATLLGGGAIAIVGLAAQLVAQLRAPPPPLPTSRARRTAWRMPPLASLPPATLGTTGRLWMVLMWAYLITACLMVILRFVQLAAGAA